MTKTMFVNNDASYRDALVIMLGTLRSNDADGDENVKKKQ